VLVSQQRALYLPIPGVPGQRRLVRGRRAVPSYSRCPGPTPPREREARPRRSCHAAPSRARGPLRTPPDHPTRQRVRTVGATRSVLGRSRGLVEGARGRAACVSYPWSPVVQCGQSSSAVQKMSHAGAWCGSGWRGLVDVVQSVRYDGRHVGRQAEAREGRCAQRGHASQRSCWQHSLLLHRRSQQMRTAPG